uniref:Uncharacterized protein n=1 Tax=Myotis myotis TaxID=51298 RepID=A0A7J7S263_MYOMY|nr:hypothetical protein mMyoMyo1_010100 [Myotis myotis]
MLGFLQKVPELGASLRSPLHSAPQVGTLAASEEQMPFPSSVKDTIGANAELHRRDGVSPGWGGSVVERRPMNQEVTARFPVRAHARGCGLNPQCGACRRLPINDSLSSLMFLSLSAFPFLSEINKNIF